MSLSYNGLWKLMIDKNLNKVGLMKVADISSGTVAKMTILMRICDKLDCDIGDLVHYVRDEGTM